MQCDSCGWAAVTTNYNLPAFDETPYDVWVEWAGRDRIRVIAAVANALGIGVRAIRERIDREEPIALGIRAEEVLRLHETMSGLGLGIRVRPEFRWGFD